MGPLGAPQGCGPLKKVKVVKACRRPCIQTLCRAENIILNAKELAKE